MRLLPGQSLWRPQTPSWTTMGHKPILPGSTHFIGVNRPAFGGTVPHFHQMSREIRQMSRIFRKWYYFFCCRLVYIFASQRNKVTNFEKRSIQNSHADRPLIYTHCIIDQCDRRHLHYTRGRCRQRLFILLTPPRPPAASTLLPLVFTDRLRKTVQRDVLTIIWWVMVS